MGRSTAKAQTLATVVSTATYPLTLADGSTLASGESRAGVDMNLAHNRALYFDFHIGIIDGFRPRSRVTEALAAELPTLVQDDPINTEEHQ